MVRLGLLDKSGWLRTAVRGVRMDLRARRARAVRAARGGVTFIAVTGSSGKTTTTCLLDAILSSGASSIMLSRWNTVNAIAKMLRTVKKSHRYAIAEVSGDHAGAIASVTDIMRPQVGVVTMVGNDHIKNFRGNVTAAQEKSTLISALPEEGIAILNADDPHVLAMRDLARAKIVTYGLSPGADIRATNITFRLPGTLEFDVSDANGAAHIVTPFTGRHWATATLAAISAARALGVAFDDIAASVRAFEPVPCRCSVHRLADGSLFVLDTYKAVHGTLDVSFDILEGVDAPRTTIVVGTLADYLGATRPKYQNAYELARKRAARVIFVGAQSARVRPREDDVAAGRFHALDGVESLDAFLLETAIPGEIVLMKSTVADHLERAFLNRKKPIACWEARCGYTRTCFECRHLRDAKRAAKIAA